MEKEVRAKLQGSILKEVRKKLNLTQKEMASVAGVASWVISNVENREIGSMPAKVFTTIVREFNINPEYIMGYESDPKYMFIEDTEFSNDTEEKSTTPVATEDTKEDEDEESAKTGPKTIYVGENADLIRDIVNELKYMHYTDLIYIKAFIEFRSGYPL